MRACAHKAYFMLYLDGKEIEDTDQYLVDIEESFDVDALHQGEIEGYKFRAQEFSGNMIDLELIEPDGTVWQSRCGYAFGSGWPDNSEGNRCYNAMPWTNIGECQDCTVKRATEETQTDREQLEKVKTDLLAWAGLHRGKAIHEDAMPRFHEIIDRLDAIIQ